MLGRGGSEGDEANGILLLEDARLMFIKLFDFGESLRQARLLPPLRAVFDQLFQIVVGEQIAVLEGARLWGHLGP